MYNRRTPTPEQIEKTKAKRNAFRLVCQQVSAATEDQRAEYIRITGDVVTCAGHTVSTYNACLLRAQNPAVTVVGGFHQWKEKGRVVRKGETGLSLWIPKSRGETPSNTVTTAPDGTPQRAGFVIGTVFDISQTAALGE